MMNNSQIKIIYKKPTEYDNLTINSINNNIIYDDNQSILDIENTAVDRPKSATLWVSGGTTKNLMKSNFCHWNEISPEISYPTERRMIPLLFCKVLIIFIINASI